MAHTAQSIIGRKTLGTLVLERAQRVVSGKPVAQPLEEFRRAHEAFEDAEDTAAAAAEALEGAQADAREADVQQDVALMTLARGLIADGADLRNPLRALGFESPAALTRAGMADEAKLLLKLDGVVQKRKELSDRTKGASAQMVRAAREVLRLVDAAAKVERRRAEAVQERRALESAWDSAWKRLRLAAEYSDEMFETSLVNQLFDGGRATRAKRVTKKKRAAAAPLAPSA